MDECNAILRCFHRRHLAGDAGSGLADRPCIGIIEPCIGEFDIGEVCVTHLHSAGENHIIVRRDSIHHRDDIEILCGIGHVVAILGDHIHIIRGRIGCSIPDFPLGGHSVAIMI